MRGNYQLRTGANWDRVTKDARFRVWAPFCKHMELEWLLPGEGFDRLRRVTMKLEDKEYWATSLPEVEPGMYYRFRLVTDRDGRFRAPDLCSRWQPQGPNGLSVLVDPWAFEWGPLEETWTGPEDVRDVGPICEVHVGTFTELGTFNAIDQGRLESLVRTGFRSIQLMPVHCFPGSRNWGYDPSLLYSPTPAYGTPDQLRALVKRAHEAGLYVGLDVVYNHFGPESNFHGWFGPYTADGKTPWGPGLASELGPVRTFLADNAALWINEYHMDYLRLDQSHFVDDRALMAIRDAVHEVLPNGRVIAEDYGRRLRLTQAAETGGIGLDAQWNFQFHHIVMGRLCGEILHGIPHHGDAVAAILDHGVLGWDEPVPVERIKARSSQCGVWVNYIASHDEIGNRGGNELDRLGAERLADRIPASAYKLGVALAILLPGVPMFFMGDEYGETAPFPFFADLRDPLVWPNLERNRPNALAIETFWKAKIQPAAVETDAKKRDILDWFQSLTEIRKRHSAVHRGEYARVRVVRMQEPEARDAVFALELLPPDRGAGGRIWTVFNLSATDFGPCSEAVPPSELHWRLIATGQEGPVDDTPQWDGEQGLPVGPWACMIFESTEG